MKERKTPLTIAPTLATDVRFILFFFFVFYFVRAGLDGIGKGDAAGTAVLDWSGGAFPDVSTYKEVRSSAHILFSCGSQDSNVMSM